MNIKVRQARNADIDTLKSFQKSLVLYERPFDSTIPRDRIIEYYNLKKLTESDKVNFLVAEIENKIVGCGFGEVRKDNDWSVSMHIGYIGLMFVEEKYRNKGVGNLLIKTLLEWFKEKKISDIRLKVYAENVNAIQAYGKYSFNNFIIEMRRILN